MKIVINTTAGNVGRIVTELVLRAQEEVVIISCHPERVTHFFTRGARVVEGSSDEPLVLDRTLQRSEPLGPGSVQGQQWTTSSGGPSPRTAAWTDGTR